MISESARATTAQEARYRIPTPPPTSRVVKVIALDGASEREIASFVDGMRRAGPDADAPDLVVMVVSAGGDARAAERIGRVASEHRVMTTTIVIAAASASDAALSKTLAQVRPWSLMVVVAGDTAYVDDILTSFR